MEATSVFDGDECNYDSECKNGNKCIDKICNLPPSSGRERTLEIEESSVGNEDSDGKEGAQCKYRTFVKKN